MQIKPHKEQAVKNGLYLPRLIWEDMYEIHMTTFWPQQSNMNCISTVK